ncbi:MAG: RNA pseudouridine synthase [Bdellovibrionota bacterium]|jgi:tRNA pseudouridine32 synthase/23S rRNA pseudouridine746 synthase|nr:RNA pseudouridine synthase [Bdellovibrionota bacterium]
MSKNTTLKKTILKKTYPGPKEGTVIDFLKSELPLSASVIKEAMIQGSCWLKKGNSKKLDRVRRAKAVIRQGDHLEFYFDPKLFERQRAEFEEKPLLLKRERDWSAWYKPAGLLTQGTKYGDSWSLMRFIEKESKGDVLLIHRLDRETDGVVVVAHNKKAAKLLSTKWQGTLVQKVYLAWVSGIVEEEKGRLDYELEGKKAITFFRKLRTHEDMTLLELRLGTGRTHQIRKHLDMYGHPVMGDSAYGSGNKNKSGLKLRAERLEFDWHGDLKIISVPEEKGELLPQ